MKTMTIDALKKLPSLTAAELSLINKAEAKPDADCPAQTDKELKQYRPWYEVHQNGY